MISAMLSLPGILMFILGVVLSGWVMGLWSQAKGKVSG